MSKVEFTDEDLGKVVTYNGTPPDMTSPSRVFEALANVLADFPTVTKGRTSAGLKYSYRGVDDALAALHPLLIKQGLFMSLDIWEIAYRESGTTSSGTQQTRCAIKAHLVFVHRDGSMYRTGVAGEGVDTQDKCLMKAQANALKYGIWYTFCVPTDEIKDSEAFPEDVPAVNVKKQAPKRSMLDV